MRARAVGSIATTSPPVCSRAMCRRALCAPAGCQIEAAGVHQLRGLLRAPEIISAHGGPHGQGSTRCRSRSGGSATEPRSVWDELFPAEQARVLQLPVERVDVHPDRLDLQLRVDGLHTLVADLRARQTERKAA